MKSFLMLMMVAFIGKNGVLPANYAAGGPATSAAKQAAEKLAASSRATPALQRVDWALVCSVPHEVLVSYSASTSSALAQRRFDSICMSVRYLQNSKFHYGDVYSDSTVPLATVVQVLYDYVTAVVEGDVVESIGQSGTFNLDIVAPKSSGAAVTCREPGYENGNRDVDLPADSSFSDIVRSTNFLRHRLSVCE